MSVVDPDFELRRGGTVLFYFPSWGFFLQSFLLFSPKIGRGGGGGGVGAPRALPLDPPLCVYIVNINEELKAMTATSSRTEFLFHFSISKLCVAGSNLSDVPSGAVS